MRKYYGLVLTAVALLAAFGCAKKADLDAERTALRTADTDWSTAIGTKNPDEFMKFVAADATIMPPNSPAVSGEAIHPWVSQMMNMAGFSVSWEPSNVEVASSGDLGYTTGSYQAQMPMPDGTTAAEHGKYATVWKKQADGTWKVVVDIFNSDIPLPTAPSDTTATQKP